MSDKKKYRLVTRSDFDGLVCAALFKSLGMLGEITFVHPKDMQDGKISVTDSDITTNLPYVEGVHLAFDHHLSEVARLKDIKPNHIIEPETSSAARVVYNYYGGKKNFPNISEELMHAVDIADSAQYQKEDIINPKKWALLNFIMDSRTGLGRFHDFKVSNYNLMMMLIDYCTVYTIDEILEMPDVKERVDFYFKHEGDFKEQLKRCSTVQKNVVVVNLLDEEVIYPGNRFMVYAMFPECNISMHVIWGLKKQNIALTVGKSIINRSSPVNIGSMMLEYGGGGHANAGTCQVEVDKAKSISQEIIDKINAMS